MNSWFYLRCFLLTFLVLEIVDAKSRPLRQLRHRRHEKTHRRALVLERRPVDLFNERSTGNDSRRLLNGGSVFVKFKWEQDGVEWCMDAIEGTYQAEDQQHPNVGIRPCAYVSGPSEQLFHPREYEYGEYTFESRFPGDFCLVIEDEGRTQPQDGDRVRLAKCSRPGALQGGYFVFDYDQLLNGQGGQIKARANPSLCLTHEGDNPDDSDRLVVRACSTDEKFFFEFRSGWYELGSSDNCVTIEDGNVSEGTRIVYDTCNGFSSHWRLDRDGLFHSRKNDNYCMAAESFESDTPIRLAKCDPDEEFQQWEWPDGFEAPVNLKSEPDRYLVPQGQTAEKGDDMVLGSSATMGFSGDAVHM